MAEGYMKKRAGEEGLAIEVKSAGTIGMKGIAPTKEALKILEKEGAEIGGLESKPLTEELINWADLILVMEPEHKARILEMCPEYEGRVTYLGEFNPEKGDIVIPDPIGRPLAFYRASFRMIRQSIEELVKWLKE